MADQYTDYLRFAYSPYRTFAKRVGGYFDLPPVVPTLQNAASIPSASEVGTQVVGAMPTTQPTVQPQPMVTLPPDPTLSEDLRRFIPRRVQDPFDFSQFRYPEAPKFRMPGMAPTRNLAEEQGYTRRVSLKAALLGALLGGGTGALAGLTGAQQGAQQSFEQDYAQRMADYQNQARLMDIENQQLASADQRAIAMRNAQMQDALRAYDIQGQRMQVEDENARAEQAARLAIAEARTKNDIERANRITKVIEGSFSVVPEDRAAYIRSGLTGEVPTTPLRPEPKTAMTSPTGTTMLNLATRLLQIGYTLDPATYSQQAAVTKQALRASADPVIRSFADLVPDERPPGPLDIRGLTAERKKAEVAGRRELKLTDQEIARLRTTETARHNRAMESIGRDRNRITEIQNAWNRKKKPGAKLEAGSSKTIIDAFGKVSKEIADIEMKLTKPGYGTEILGGELRARAAMLRKQLQDDFVTPFAGQFRFGGIGSGTPTITRIPGSAEPAPGGGGTPASPKKRTVTRIVNGIPITITED